MYNKKLNYLLIGAHFQNTCFAESAPTKILGVEENFMKYWNVSKTETHLLLQKIQKMMLHLNKFCCHPLSDYLV